MTSGPETLKAYIEEEVKRGGYSTPSEFLRALVRERQRERLKEEVEQKLLAGLRSGNAREMTAHDWGRIRSQVLGRVGRKGRAEREGKRKKAPASRR